jgi:hypothetical protein
MKDKNQQEWNVLVVRKYGQIASSKDEFQVCALTMRGAVMKAENRLRKDPEKNEWKIKSIWRLDPDSRR